MGIFSFLTETGAEIVAMATALRVSYRFFFDAHLWCQVSRTLLQYIQSYNPTNIFARARLVKTRHVSEYSPAKTGEYPRIFPNFQNCAHCVKDLMDNKDNSLHLGRKYARIFVLGHYLFLVAHSFPRATLSENCSLLGTDNVRGQIS